MSYYSFLRKMFGLKMDVAHKISKTTMHPESNTKPLKINLKTLGKQKRALLYQCAMETTDCCMYIVAVDLASK